MPTPLQRRGDQNIMPMQLRENIASTFDARVLHILATPLLHVASGHRPLPSGLALVQGHCSLRREVGYDVKQVCFSSLYQGFLYKI